MKNHAAVKVSVVECLTAEKQHQDPIQDQPLANTKSKEKTTENITSESAAPDDKVIPSSATPVGASVLSRKSRTFPELLLPWSSPVDIDDLANKMAILIKRYCVVTDEEADAAVLWIISSYLINGFNIFPKLSLISPQKRCGKSTLMEVISAMSRDGLFTSNVSAASIYRLTEQYELTLFIDEADTFLKNGNPELVGLINSSHNKNSANILRCTGDDHTPRSFSTWMAMALASIRELPPTIMDRSIVINLRRMKATESVARIPGNLLGDCQPIRRKLLSWCGAQFAYIESNPVEPPRIGNDRAADNWLPLFTVAGQIGKLWPFRCETAYHALTTVSEPELPTQLLMDIRTILGQHGMTQITSEELLRELCNDSAKPWSTFNNGKPLTSNKMAVLLRPYNIKPKAMRFPSGSKRGYMTEQFTDAFERYLP
jgi:hypothetical protein